MLKSGSRPVHIPDRMPIERPSISRFCGSWKGISSIRSRNCSPNRIISAWSMPRSWFMLIPPNRSNTCSVARSISARSAPGSSTSSVCMLCTRRAPSRVPTAISASVSPSRRVSGTRPTIPKSMNVSRQAGSPGAAPGCGVTNRLPGCGSAWKKPSTKICCRYVSASTVATSPRSMPAALMASWSPIRIALTSSRVSTRRAVSSQTTRGTLTRTSSAKLVANVSALLASAK
ncbi:hypothetical protein SDC9_100481 [bioreactor metagenome]|uniref:Uncharacterized protein n=1 Tax=bioreactor metagenome TaxID=1076179 RepID=A0A645AKH1_9ZZZZ